MDVTLSDIAKQVGVVPSTVLRALDGRDGVGIKKREMIQRVAMEMGYRRSSPAPSFRNGAKNIAIVLPDPTSENRFYMHYLREGALQCVGDYASLGVNPLFFGFVRTPEDHGGKLREVLALYGDRLDGILTLGSSDQEAEQALAEANRMGIPVALAVSDSGEGRNRLCCARIDDGMAGRLAADLLINFTIPQRPGKIILTGNFAVLDQFHNAQNFERQILESGFPLEIIKLSSPTEHDQSAEKIKKVLNSGLNITAMYATSARTTAAMCGAVEECPGAESVRAIGSDLFPESVAMLRRRLLHAVIHKRPSEQSYQAMRALLHFVINGEKPEADNIFIEYAIVMQSNLDGFLKKTPVDESVSQPRKSTT